MTGKGHSDELERALARPDADRLVRQIDAYAAHHANGAGDWPEEHAADFDAIMTAHWDDPDRVLAYVALGVARSDDARFLALLGCGLLEDLLYQPSVAMIERVVAEARKSARFRWLLSHPFKVTVSAEAWAAIERFRITGPHEEPPYDTLPPR